MDPDGLSQSGSQLIFAVLANIIISLCANIGQFLQVAQTEIVTFSNNNQDPSKILKICELEVRLIR